MHNGAEAAHTCPYLDALVQATSQAVVPEGSLEHLLQSSLGVHRLRGGSINRGGAALRRRIFHHNSASENKSEDSDTTRPTAHEQCENAEKQARICLLVRHFDMLHTVRTNVRPPSNATTQALCASAGWDEKKRDPENIFLSDKKGYPSFRVSQN